MKVRLRIEGLGEGWLTDEYTASDWGQPAFLRQQDGQIHALDNLPISADPELCDGVQYTETEVEWVRLWLPLS